MVSDRVGDFVIRLKNAGAIGNKAVTVPYSKHLEAIARKLKELGFVGEVSHDGKTLGVALAYDERGEHRIHDVKRISKPGRRMYVHAREAHSVKNGIGARLISSPKGVISDREARRIKVGGENLFEIW